MINGSVTLRRNYADLPFDATENSDTALQVLTRVTARLQQEEETWIALPESRMDEEGKRVFRFLRLIGDDIDDAANAQLFVLKGDSAAVQAAAGDHVAVTVTRSADDLEVSYQKCKDIIQKLGENQPYAKTGELGYLTARPCDAGTGLRASLLLHLPMIQLSRQLPMAMKLCGEKGLLLRPETVALPGQAPALYLV